MNDNTTKILEAIWQGQQTTLQGDPRTRMILFEDAFYIVDRIALDTKSGPATAYSRVTMHNTTATVIPSDAVVDWILKEWGVFDWYELIDRVNAEQPRFTNRPIEPDDVDDYPAPPTIQLRLT